VAIAKKIVFRDLGHTLLFCWCIGWRQLKFTNGVAKCISDMPMTIAGRQHCTQKSDQRPWRSILAQRALMASKSFVVGSIGFEPSQIWSCPKWVWIDPRLGHMSCINCWT